MADLTPLQAKMLALLSDEPKRFIDIQMSLESGRHQTRDVLQSLLDSDLACVRWLDEWRLTPAGLAAKQEMTK